MQFPLVSSLKRGGTSSLQSNRVREALWGYLLIAPSILGVLAFTLIPVVVSFGISLTKWTLLTPPEFVGFANYRKLVTDPVAAQVMRNTLYFTLVSVPLGLALSLGLAVALNQKIRGLAVFRTAYYLPVISASVAVSMVWMWILDGNYGLLNSFLASIGIPPTSWLTSRTWAMPAVILVSVWKNLGFNMIIFLAALQDVPKELYEVAKIDGAKDWKIFRHITLPLITPAIFFTLITGLIGSFQSFDLIYNMTEGGPARSTSVISYYIWQQAFEFLHMGYGAALAYALFFVILLITLIQWRARRRWVYGEE